MDVVLIFDGDNTLWDTDSVFRNAQIAMLTVLADHGLLQNPEDHLETLRSVDRVFIQHHCQSEYDFGLLARALIYLYSDSLTPQEAVLAVVTQESQSLEPQVVALAEQAVQEFYISLQRIPPLFPETKPLVDILKSYTDTSIKNILFSEGKPQRIRRTLDCHALTFRSFFDEVIIDSKDREAFERLKELFSTDVSCIYIAIGDSMRQEIKFGNQAGMITLYKPGAFKGNEPPLEDDEQPDYIINSLAELPSILTQLGVHPPSRNIVAASLSG